MDSSLLRSLLENDAVTSARFGGVYPCDLLPLSKNPRQQYFVANTDESHREGAHWVAIRRGGPESDDEYFDSYGLFPLNQHLDTYLGPSYLKGTRTLQSAQTTVCGQYCLFFIHNRCRGWDFKTILTEFGNERLANDIKVNEWVNATYGLSLGIRDEDFLYNKFGALQGTQGCTCPCRCLEKYNLRHILK